jgi:splicing factor 3B subunit 1
MQKTEASEKGVGLLESGYFDSDLYDGNGTQKSQYLTSIPNDYEDDDEDEEVPVKRAGFGAPAAMIQEISRVSLELCFSTGFKSQNPRVSFQNEPDYDPFADRRRPTVGEKEDEYRQKRRKLVISPERIDPFADGEFPKSYLKILLKLRK